MRDIVYIVDFSSYNVQSYKLISFISNCTYSITNCFELNSVRLIEESYNKHDFLLLKYLQSIGFTCFKHLKIVIALFKIKNRN